MHRGYTKRWRKRWDKGYHKDHLLWILMDYFIDHANHKDTKVYFQGCGLIPVKRGQHIFGTLQLAVFLGVDRSRLRRKLKILETVGFSTIETTNRYSILTVINYDTYQPMQNEIDQQIGQPPTSHRPATDHQTTTPNNVKNVKNVKKKPKKNIRAPFTPPSIEDVKAYFRENGFSEESAETFHKYYSNGEPPWHDGNGKPVKSWKQKAVAVWFKDENKHLEGKKPWHV